LEFNKSLLRCLQKAASQVQTQEQTQEIRLSDAMPDIGRVLGSWGQVVIRGKEWQGDTMAVSGGVMVWALYAPEDGTDPRVVDAWMPFQIKWDTPQNQLEGAVQVCPELKSMDVRSTSSRKLMARSVVSVLAEALQPMDAEVYEAATVPEDVQLLKQTYPVELPREYGEKTLRLDEQLRLEPQMPDVRKIVYCRMQPTVREYRVMGSRLVFRGVGKLSMLYMDQNGQILKNSWELPFSQFADLNGEYSPQASAWIMPIVTGMEAEPDEDRGIYLKCGIACQYTIYDRQMLEVVADAYSPVRKVGSRTEMLNLPMLLERKEKNVQIRKQSQMDGIEPVDVVWYKGHPRILWNEDKVESELAGQFQILYRDAEGLLQSSTVRSEDSWQIPSDEDNQVQIYWKCESEPDMLFQGEGADISVSMTVEEMTFAQQGIPMVTALELGEAEAPDPGRPSLILRRAVDENLWMIAKNAGSTVELIQKANNLEGEPQVGQMLLIPVS